MRPHVVAYVLYALLGATIGLPGIALYQIAGEYGSIAEVTMWLGIIFVFWCAKPLFGLVADLFPLCGHRRVPYIAVSSTMAALFSLLISALPLTKSTFLALALAGQFWSCFQDVMIDAVLCACARSRDAESGQFGSFQTRAWMLREAAAGLAAMAGGLVVSSRGPKAVYAAMAGLYASVALVVLALMPRDFDLASGERPSIRAQLRAAAQNLGRPKMRSLLLYQLLTSVLPTEGTSFYFFLTSEVGFTTTTMGVLAAIGTAAKVLGYLSYDRWFRGGDVQRFFYWISVAGIALRAPPLVLALRANGPVSPLLLSLSDDVLGEALSGVAGVPLLVATAHLTDPSVEAAVYSANASLGNLASLLSRVLASKLTAAFGIDHSDFRNLWLLVLCCGSLDALVGIPAIFLLPKGSVTQMVREERARRPRVSEGGPPP